MASSDDRIIFHGLKPSPSWENFPQGNVQNLFDFQNDREEYYNPQVGGSNGMEHIERYDMATSCDNNLRFSIEDAMDVEECGENEMISNHYLPNNAYSQPSFEELPENSPLNGNSFLSRPPSNFFGEWQDAPIKTESSFDRVPSQSFSVGEAESHLAGMRESFSVQLDEGVHDTSRQQAVRGSSMSPRKRAEEFFEMEEHSDRQTEEYLGNGLREMEEAINSVFGEWQYPHLAMRARDIFRRAVAIQAEQKEGVAKFNHRRASDNGEHRLRFGRRKAFVITAIVIAMKEFGLSLPGGKKRKDRDAVRALSDVIPGKQKVSLDSVKSCCSTLGIQIRLS